MSMAGPSGAFDRSGFFDTGKSQPSMVPALGVSVIAAPMISAPAARQTPEFQALIAVAAPPSTPAITPPRSGSSATDKLARSDASGQLPGGKLAYIAELALQMAASGGGGPSGDRHETKNMFAGV